MHLIKLAVAYRKRAHVFSLQGAALSCLLLIIERGPFLTKGFHVRTSLCFILQHYAWCHINGGIKQNKTKLMFDFTLKFLQLLSSFYISWSPFPDFRVWSSNCRMRTFSTFQEGLRTLSIQMVSSPYSLVCHYQLTCFSQVTLGMLVFKCLNAGHLYILASKLAPVFSGIWMYSASKGIH